jgi:hypothetical protein
VDNVDNSTVLDNSAGSLFIHDATLGAVESNSIDTTASVMHANNFNISKNQGARLLCDSSLRLLV